MSTCFDEVQKIRYEGASTTNLLAYRWYDPDAIIDGKPMREHLKFAISWWHTLCGAGVDMFGEASTDKSFQGKKGMDLAYAKIDAGFALMDILGVDYFCFHDYDLVDEQPDLAKTNQSLDLITDYILDHMKTMGKKCLWGTAKLFNHKRYMHGAGTAPEADVFAYAAAQIKKNIDITHKLKGSGIVFWGGREGYETLLNTDMGLELDNMARLLSMSVAYARSIGYAGAFYIEPKPKEPMKHQYDFDVATTIGFLRKYGLDKDFKINVEANHATLAGHTFQHELRSAAINGMFGSIDANQGDLLLGWDTDQFPTDVYNTTMCMLEVIRAGGFSTGGLNFDAKTRRGSFELLDIIYSYIAGIDAFALGFLKAREIIADGRIQGFVDMRYQSWKQGIGKQILDGAVDLVDLEAYTLAQGEVKGNRSSRQEYLEHIINTILFNERRS